MIINNKNISDSYVANIILQVKQKKEFSTISDEVVKNELEKILRHSSKYTEYLSKEISEKEFEKSKTIKQIVKDLRSKFRKNFGVFQIQKNDASKIIEKITIKDENSHDYILNFHRSTNERLNLYKCNLYKELFEKSIVPKTILDLGCGYNPFSFYYMNLKKVEYFASDISDDALNDIKSYYEKIGQKANVKVIDLRQLKTNSNIIRDFTKKQVDICFLFKVFDSVETKGHKLAEEILKNIPSKFIIASFSTQLVKNIQMNHPYRGWMDRMLERLDLKFEVLVKENEIFYIIDNNKQ